MLGKSKTNWSALGSDAPSGVISPSAWRLKHRLMLVAMVGREANGHKTGQRSENKRPFVIAVSTSDDGLPQDAVSEPVTFFTNHALSE